MVFLFCLDVIIELLVFHELVYVSDCWILLEAEMCPCGGSLDFSLF